MQYLKFARAAVMVVVMALVAAPADAETMRELWDQAERILVLGDSITYAGDYVTHLETWRVAQPGSRTAVVINAGLPSETVSGLSEPGHAGGAFPRPHLDRRLTRVLDTTRPQLVIACYGMNCGIYLPLDDERFASYREGIQNLRQAVLEHGAKLILVTPPTHDDQQNPNAAGYDRVLAHYSQWLIDQRQHGWHVIDLHGPMAEELQRRRQADPKFTFQPDGVHPDMDGHWFIAQQLMLALDDRRAAEWSTAVQMMDSLRVPPAAASLIERRMHLQRDAYLTAAGHDRPGIPAGPPLDQARASAAKLTEQIEHVTP